MQRKTENPTGWWPAQIPIHMGFVAAGTLVLLAAIWFDVIPLLRGPAPYPPEWQWIYLEGSTATLTLGTALAGSALLGLLVVSGLPWAQRRPRAAAGALLLGASILGAGLQLALVEKARPFPVIGTLTRLTLSRDYTGHYSLGVSELARHPISFLRKYPELVPQIHQRFPPHPATNPPGSSLFYRGVLAVCDGLPAVREAVLGVAYGIDPELRNFQRTSAKMAAAVLAPLLLVVLCASACWPIAVVARSFGAGPLEAARIGLLWTLLPGPTLMVPMIDQGIAWLMACTAALLATALVRRTAWPLRGFASGVTAFVACFVSYGSAAFVCITGALSLAVYAGTRRQLGHALRVTGLAAGGAFAALGIVVALGYRPLDAFRASMEIHFGIYTAARSYSTWLIFGPWDLALFVGAPIAALLGIRVCSGVRDLFRDGVVRLHDPALRGQLALLAALMVLFLSGTLRGEVGRSALPVMPLVLVATLLPAGGREEAAPTGANVRNGAPSAHLTLLLGGLLLLTCWVMRSSWSLP